jgi:prefoldin subunit 5
MFDDEKQKLNAQFAADKTKDNVITQLTKEKEELEGRLQEMDFLLDDIDKHMQEKEAMHDYEKMVEEMVEEIAKKDEEIEEFASKYSEVEEEQRLMEDLNNQLEQYNKELLQESEEKDLKVAQKEEEVE